MEILSTFSFPLFCGCPKISSKRVLSCPREVLNQRCNLEINSIDKTSPRQGRGTTLSGGEEFSRRKMILFPVLGLGTGTLAETLKDNMAMAAEFTDMPALRGKDYGKTKMRYPDFMETDSGLQYKDLRIGNGPIPKMGDVVVVDWDGYTIGYYGRIFEARNKSKGGSFEGGEKDYFKFQLGSKQVIPAFEEAVSSMGVGGIRSCSTRFEESYKPLVTTFALQRRSKICLKTFFCRFKLLELHLRAGTFRGVTDPAWVPRSYSSDRTSLTRPYSSPLSCTTRAPFEMTSLLCSLCTEHRMFPYLKSCFHT